jgi:tetratricopeptide (TPR) repeat protein
MLGDFYLRSKKFDQAIAQYKAGESSDPKRAVAYQERAILAYDLGGKHDEALSLAKTLAEKNPKATTANEIYATLLLATGLKENVAKSLSELSILSKNNPTNPVLHLDLAKANLAAGDATKALSEALEALQDEGKNANPRSQVMLPGRLIAARIYGTRRQFAQTLEQANQVLAVEPANPEARLLKDQALVGLHQEDQALDDLLALVKQYPRLIDANEALGHLYLNTKQYDKASEQFEAISKTAPNDPRGYLGVQEVKLAQGKVEEVVRSLADLVAKNPDNAAYRLRLANVQLDAGRRVIAADQAAAKNYFQQAADNYKLILKTNSNSSEVWLRLGMLQQFMGQNDAALASFEQANHVDPQNAQALISRAQLLQGMKKTKDATDLYNQALGIDPNNPFALNNLAFLNAQQGSNLDQAMSFAERAKKQAPKNPDIADTLGYVYLQKNLNAQALQIFRQNVQDQPTNATFHLHLAMALLKNGDKQGARDEAEKAMRVAAPAQQSEIKSFVGQIG